MSPSAAATATAQRKTTSTTKTKTKKTREEVVAEAKKRSSSSKTTTPTKKTSSSSPSKMSAVAKMKTKMKTNDKKKKTKAPLSSSPLSSSSAMAMKEKKLMSAAAVAAADAMGGAENNRKRVVVSKRRKQQQQQQQQQQLAAKAAAAMMMEKKKKKKKMKMSSSGAASSSRKRREEEEEEEEDEDQEDEEVKGKNATKKAVLSAKRRNEDIPTSASEKTKKAKKMKRAPETLETKGKDKTAAAAAAAASGLAAAMTAALDASKKDKTRRTRRAREKEKSPRKKPSSSSMEGNEKKGRQGEVNDNEENGNDDAAANGGGQSGGRGEDEPSAQDVSMMRDEDVEDVDRGEDFGDDDDGDDFDDDEDGGDDYHDDDDDNEDEDEDDEDILDDEDEEEDYSDDEDDSEGEGRRGGGDRHDGGLHALLSRLGGAMEGMGGGSRSGLSARLRDVLKALTFDREAENGGIDDTAIVIALNELCEIVVTSSEELLATSLSPEPFAQALLNCCNLEHNPELMLLAVRAMTSMADILPNTRGAFVRAGALPTLCQKLFAIEYIDVAEQSLSALEKLTRGYYGSKAAEAGALTAALAHLDFFGVGMQGVSMQMASNVCAEFPTKSLSPGAVEAIPTLLSLLLRDDQKVATLACNCLVSLSLKAKKLADRRVSFLLQKEKEQKEQQLSEEQQGEKATTTTTTTTTTKTDTTSSDRQKKKKDKSSSSEMDPVAVNETISLILSDALCERCLEIVREAAGNTNSTNNVTHSRLLYRGCVKILATILEARPEMSIFLLKNGVAQILAEHLERCKIVRANVGASEYSPVQSMDDLHDAMHLLGLLLPSQVKNSGDSKKTSVVIVGAEELQKLFTKPENSSLVSIFGEYLAPTLCHVAESPSNVTIKRKALSTLTAWTQLVDIATFEDVSKDVAPIAAVVARALIDPQGELLKEAAKLCAMALEKSNETNQDEEEGEFIKRFAKEGGAHALEVRSKEYNFLIAEAAEKSAVSEEKTLLNPPTSTPQFQISTNPKEEGLRICSEVRNSYFGPGKAHLIASEGLDRLRKACAKLKSAPLSDSSSGKSAKNPRDSKEFSSAFSKIFEALAMSDISAFELSECGAASTLRKFLCASDVPSSPSSSKSINIDCEEATERLAIFTRAAGDAPTGAFETLVRLLVETLQTRERLPISVSEHAVANSNSSYARFRASSGAPSTLAPSTTAGDPGLNLLARPLKVRLKRSSKCDATKVEDYGNSVVMIEPLAQLSAVEAFLYSRVKKKPAAPAPAQQPPSTSAPSTATATHAEANQAGSAADREMDHDEDDFDEEDYDDMDEEDFHDDDDDDDMDDMDHEEDYMDDEDDEENLLGPEGEDMAHPPASAEEIAAPPANAASPAPPSQQEQGAATASTANAGEAQPHAQTNPGASGRSFASVAAGSDSKRPRLAFSVNDGDTYIQDTKNVLAAVTQVSIGDSVKPMSGRLWDQPCVLYYDIVDNNDPKFKGIISEGGEDSAANDSSKPSLVETVVEENLFSNPSVKSDVKAVLGPVASTVFNAQFGYPDVVEGLEDDSVRDALATLTLCHLVTEDAKKILRTAGPEKTSSGAHPPTSDNMMENDDGDTDGVLLTADKMRIANLSSAKVHAENLFLAPKLSGKLRAQLRDTLSVCARRVPEWTSALAKTCPWLFTLDERVLLFHCASFSVARALHQLHGDGKASNGANGNAANAGAGNTGGDPRGGARVGRLQRQKVRIRREHVLSSAIKVFSSPQTRKHVLEVEFYDEVGTGIGPTNEFYALVSKDLQRASHGIFRGEHSASPTSSDNTEDLVNAPHGLFPKPLRAMPNAPKAIEIFRCVGRAIGKVLQDGRLLDVKFNPNFFKKLYGLPLGLDDLELLEPELFSTLKKLEAAVRDGTGRLDGAKIEDLCLEFALPDGAEIEGTTDADEIVTAENASRYIAAVVDDVLGAGVEPLFQACREGFADIVSDPSQLAMFSLSEIDALTCGADEQTKWTERDLREHILCDHGYQVNSKPVAHLREILTNMSDVERRSFLKFTTGSPRLPIGGLASLNPKLKVVCKQPTVLSEVGGGMNTAEMISEGTELADADLPSAMTCANYLKLPPYSSKEALELKLKLAISEGVGSFDLS